MFSYLKKLEEDSRQLQAITTHNQTPETNPTFTPFDDQEVQADAPPSLSKEESNLFNPLFDRQPEKPIHERSSEPGFIGEASCAAFSNRLLSCLDDTYTPSTAGLSNYHRMNTYGRLPVDQGPEFPERMHVKLLLNVARRFIGNYHPLFLKVTFMKEIDAVYRREVVPSALWLSMRLAQSLGMHRSASRHTTLTPVERESRRRTWWVLYFFDRFSASKLGQPITVRDDDIDVEMPSMDGLTKDEMAEFLDPQNLITNIKLAKIIGNILTHIYGIPKATNGLYIHQVHGILKQLREWHDELQPDMRVKERGTPRPVASLHLAYNQCIIQTTRPVLLHLFKTQFQLGNKVREDALPRQNVSSITLALAESCVNAAQASSRIVEGLFLDGSIATFGYWDAHHIFSAAMILIMSAVMKPTAVNSDHLETLLSVLRSLKNDGNIPAVDFCERLSDIQARVLNLRATGRLDGMSFDRPPMITHTPSSLPKEVPQAQDQAFQTPMSMDNGSGIFASKMLRFQGRNASACYNCHRQKVKCTGASNPWTHDRRPVNQCQSQPEYPARRGAPDSLVEDSTVEAFIRRLREAVGQETNHLTPIPPRDHGEERSETLLSRESLSLPPYEYASQLVARAEQEFGDCHTFLRKSFLRRFHATYRGQQSETYDRKWLCRLFFVLALAECTTTTKQPIQLTLDRAVAQATQMEGFAPSENMLSSGVELFEHGLSLLNTSYEEPTVDDVEALNLASHCCYILNRRMSAYAYAGQSVRLAHCLGLDHPAPKSLSKLEQEHRKRVWWTAFCVDRMISTELALHPAYTGLGQELGYPDSSGLTDEEEEEFFDPVLLTALIKLCEIKTDVVNTLAPREPHMLVSCAALPSVVALSDELYTINNICLQAARSNARILLELAQAGELVRYGYWDSAHLFSSLAILTIAQSMRNHQPNAFSCTREDMLRDAETYSKGRNVLVHMVQTGNMASRQHLSMLEEVERHGTVLSALTARDDALPVESSSSEEVTTEMELDFEWWASLSSMSAQTTSGTGGDPFAFL
ncbi:hypothetical protein FocTR4_00007663 [Fusarium oxysporum f. sp. cubense]|uniref:Xylanolytic transcriptional activator regulatory domain-containing protein n=1 Tax=Fusarium oxysporum f. sp. cubense TaxID=61366 RepID=A0A5C6TKH9_FUSOC|nr:hypothetical protein FocTR4_00007663 [Fusarium oxysporum f. sp. cubense]